MNKTNTKKILCTQKKNFPSPTMKRWKNCSWKFKHTKKKQKKKNRE